MDHLVAGDNHNLENLKAVHHATPPHCHRYKSSDEGNEAQRLNKTKRRL